MYHIPPAKNLILWVFSQPEVQIVQILIPFWSKILFLINWTSAIFFFLSFFFWYLCVLNFSGTFVIPLSSSVATFDADHPFIFFLRDRESGAILFEGILSNPQEFSESVRPSESHIQPQAANKIPPPASSVSAASKPNLAQSTDNQGTLQSLSTFMNSTQFGFYNLNQNQGANNLSGSKEKPTVAPKIPEITGNKPSSNNHVQSTKRPVVQYPESEYYQKPIPSDQDAILFSANQTNQNTNTRVQNQNTRYRQQGWCLFCQCKRQC